MRVIGTGAVRQQQRRESIVFGLIVSAVACAASLPALLVSLSRRPDLYFVKPSAAAPGVTPVDWKALGDLLNSTERRPALFEGEIEVAGYMLPVAPGEARGSVSRFLLVPDPGDWLHAPHLHSGEAIGIWLKDGRSVPLLDGTAVTVRGSLSWSSLGASPGVVFQLAATAVDVFQR